MRGVRADRVRPVNGVRVEVRAAALGIRDDPCEGLCCLSIAEIEPVDIVVVDTWWGRLVAAHGQTEANFRWIFHDLEISEPHH